MPRIARFSAVVLTMLLSLLLSGCPEFVVRVTVLIDRPVIEAVIGQPITPVNFSVLVQSSGPEVTLHNFVDSGDKKGLTFTPNIQAQTATLSGTPTATGTIVLEVTVRYGIPGAPNQTSEPATLSGNVHPALTQLSPTTAVAGSGGFTLTVMGDGFANTGSLKTRVLWNGSAFPLIDTIVRSATQVDVTVLNSDIASAGTAQISVDNGSSQGGIGMVVAAGAVTGATSLPFTITAAPATPTITTASPLPAATVGTAYSQRIQATGGTTPYSWTEVLGAGGASALPPGLVLAQAPAPNANDALISGTPTAAGTFSFTARVTDAASPSGSNSKSFSIQVNPAVTLTSIAVTPAAPTIPVNATLGFTATGTFSDNSTLDLTASVAWTATDVTGTSVASISSVGVATANFPGTATIRATDTPTGVSGTALLTVVPQPSITSLAPNSAVAGGTGFTLTVNGGGFDATSLVMWNGSSRTTTFVSTSQLTASIPASDLAVATPLATINVTVVNSPPGGVTVTSNALPFTITAPPQPSQLGVLERISVDTAGNGSTTGQSPSGGTEGKALSMSEDGRYVVFQSSGALDAGDANGVEDVYLRDTCRGPSAPANCTKSTQRIPGVATPDIPTGSPGISGDGRWIVFAAGDVNSPTTNAALLARQTSGGPTVVLASAATDRFHSPVLSYDGRFVAFVTRNELVAANPLQNDNVFLLDRDADGNGVYDEPGPGRLLLQVSLTSSGATPNFFSTAPAISADGRFVVFVSAATDLLPAGQDTNNSDDVFLYDRTSGTITRVNVDTAGNQAVTSFNRHPAISGDGRFIAFVSSADNLIAPGQDTNAAEDVFLRDTCFGAPAGCSPSTIRVSVSSTGAEAVRAIPANPLSANSMHPSLSFTGRFISFSSVAQNLVASDPNIDSDTFVRDTCFGAPAGCQVKTILISAPLTGGPPSGGGSFFTIISADGSLVVFSSSARNLVPGDNSTNWDTFLAGTGLNVNLP